MKKQLIILIGAPCSGKSTWSKDYVNKNPNTLRFNRDEIRLMLKGKLKLEDTEEKVVTQMITEGIDNAFLENKSVIIDQTNCRLKYINGFINSSVNDPNIEIKFKIIHQPLEVLFERNINRSRVTGLPKIPEEIIINMHNNLTKMIETSEFKKLVDKYECLV